MTKFDEILKEEGWIKPYEEVPLWYKNDPVKGMNFVSFSIQGTYELYQNPSIEARMTKESVLLTMRAFVHTFVKDEDMDFALPMLAADFFHHDSTIGQDNWKNEQLELKYAKMAMEANPDLTEKAFSRNLAKELIKIKQKTMDFKQYQAAAKETAIYPEQVKGLYPIIGLLGETAETIQKVVGEEMNLSSVDGVVIEDLEEIEAIFKVVSTLGARSEVIKKRMRKQGLKSLNGEDGGAVSGLRVWHSAEEKEEIKKELGDILWYIAATCSDLNIDLNDVAQANIDKLNSRKQRGVIAGSGDNR